MSPNALLELSLAQAMFIYMTSSRVQDVCQCWVSVKFQPIHYKKLTSQHPFVSVGGFSVSEGQLTFVNGKNRLMSCAFGMVL